MERETTDDDKTLLILRDDSSSLRYSSFKNFDKLVNFYPRSRSNIHLESARKACSYGVISPRNVFKRERSDFHRSFFKRE